MDAELDILESPVVKSDEVPALKVLGAQVRFLCEADRTNGAWSLMQVTVPRDAGPPPHVHAWDEAYYVLEGELEFTLGPQRFVASAGDFVCTPGGAPHGFRGRSEAPARVLIFDAPAHAATFFKRVDREVTSPGDVPNVLRIGDETGIHFLPPA